MDLTIRYDGMRITRTCYVYSPEDIEIEGITCPDHDYEVADFVADRYERDQQFAMTVQDMLQKEYHMVLGEEAAMRQEMHQEEMLLAAGGGR